MYKMVTLRHFRVILERCKLLPRFYISCNYTVSQCVFSLQRYEGYSLLGNEKSITNSLTECKLFRRSLVKTADTRQSKEYRLNSCIKAKNVRLIDQEGKNLGIITLKEALEKGKKENCLVVEVGQTPSESVCKLVSQQQLYEKMKEVKKKNVKTRKMKEVKVTAKICKHDLDIKLKKIVEFLKDRDSVKVFVAHRRLQNTSVDDKKALIQRIAELVSDVGCLQGEVKVVGNGVKATFIPLQKR